MNTVERVRLIVYVLIVNASLFLAYIKFIGAERTRLLQKYPLKEDFDFQLSHSITGSLLIVFSAGMVILGLIAVYEPLVTKILTKAGTTIFNLLFFGTTKPVIKKKTGIFGE